MIHRRHNVAPAEHRLLKFTMMMRASMATNGDDNNERSPVQLMESWDSTIALRSACGVKLVPNRTQRCEFKDQWDAIGTAHVYVQQRVQGSAYSVHFAGADAYGHYAACTCC
jgi:hypothetical protein